ncbi:MAG: hypothetical protein JWN07_1039 [Hyphomicrobiales bacterium]|nr:hypothetical protein [Hyphomicrobiales bacterium]
MIPDEDACDVGVEAGHAASLHAGLGQPHAEMRGAGDGTDVWLRGQGGGTGGDFKAHARAVLRLRMTEGAGRMQQDRGRAAGARGLREAARGDEIEMPHGGAEIGDDGRRRPAAQRLLHRPQQVRPALRAHEDEASGVDAMRGEPRPVGRAVLAQRKFVAHPQDRAVMAGGEPGRERQREAGGGGKVAHAGGRRLIERAAEQPAEQPVEHAGLPPEGESPHRRGGHAATGVIEPRKGLAEIADSFRTAAGGHRLGDFRSCYVLI